MGTLIRRRLTARPFTTQDPRLPAPPERVRARERPPRRRSTATPRRRRSRRRRRRRRPRSARRRPRTAAASSARDGARRSLRAPTQISAARAPFRLTLAELEQAGGVLLKYVAKSGPTGTVSALEVPSSAPAAMTSPSGEYAAQRSRANAGAWRMFSPDPASYLRAPTGLSKRRRPSRVSRGVGPRPLGGQLQSIDQRGTMVRARRVYSANRLSPPATQRVCESGEKQTL